jgi:predicted SprT family Zn-dependent metalloprotease
VPSRAADPTTGEECIRSVGSIRLESWAHIVLSPLCPANMPEENLDQYAASLLADLCARFPMGYVPALRWKNLRVTAGTAYYKTGEIVLSRTLLCTTERLDNTLKHEYAHLLAVKRHGRKAAGHGVHWKQAMADLGLQPVVRHTYEVQRNQPRQKVEYRCDRCGHTFTRSRRLPRRRKYFHVHCGGPIKLMQVQRAMPDATSS